MLVPMVQLAPDFKHPLLMKSMADLLDDLNKDGQAVFPLKGGTLIKLIVIGFLGVACLQDP